MKRRQILTNWSWLLSIRGSATESRPFGGSEKNSTLSEVSEYARALARESLSGLAPITHPDERQRREQAHHGERRSSQVE